MHPKMKAEVDPFPLSFSLYRVVGLFFDAQIFLEILLVGFPSFPTASNGAEVELISGIIQAAKERLPFAYYLSPRRFLRSFVAQPTGNRFFSTIPSLFTPPLPFSFSPCETTPFFLSPLKKRFPFSVFFQPRFPSYVAQPFFSLLPVFLQSV